MGMVVITPLNALIEWQDNGRPLGSVHRRDLGARHRGLALLVYVDRPKQSRSPANDM
jgi:hypothetical protein